MIFHHPIFEAGPGIAGVLSGAGLWVVSMWIVLFHRSGIQVVGMAIACIGILMMLLQPQYLLSFSLLVIGFAVHGFGRLLLNLKRRG